ncbi:helix-turn-helix domain-containing protein [Phyllobacterium sp. P30BS-XVII]|uniref:helix-turn-helix domain-containing protein n=1 Tax=Phyllobacterium sp. P30BS-XVII TaxID=2587046 RepID=UPI00183D35DE|nr:helix-turn-helix domain-containing protein [Phyllobacterium sp. P30BS-XVII]MBA8901339.1 chromosomal replication initiation ATPase DnaA [Phyllobacterium sp. P30BS-XVII]
MSENFPHLISSVTEARAMIDILRQRRSRQRAIKPFIPDNNEPLDERLFQVCDSVIDILSGFFNVSGRDLRSHSRCERSVARVRQIGMYVAHVTLSLSMSEVGRAFGRDRSTVNHACHLIEDMRDEPEFDRIINTIENILRAAFLRSGMVRR